MVRTSTSVAALLVLYFGLTAGGVVAEPPSRRSAGEIQPAGPADFVYADRVLQPRALQPWREVVARRQAEFAANPNAPEFARTIPTLKSAAAPAVIAANETDPVQALLTVWPASTRGVPDFVDRMWMSIIGTTARAGATPYVYVLPFYGDDPNETLTVAKTMLAEYEGVAENEVVWMQLPLDSIWIRDYGPLFVRDLAGGNLSIEDPLYYPQAPWDDAQPADFAARIGAPLSDFNLYFEGGNFLPNGGGLCIVSSVVLDANPHYSETDIRNMFLDELGCVDLVIVQALDDAATGHVDMWLAWANHTTLVVGEYAQEQDPVNRAIIEKNLSTLLTGLVDPASNQPVEIVRMPMPSNCPPRIVRVVNDEIRVHPGVAGMWSHLPRAAQACPGLPPTERVWRTYLNVAFVNGTVLLPVYQQDQRHEAEAIEVWTDLGFDVVPVPSDFVIHGQGATHCIVKTMDR